jgi:hypothetical protein
MRSNLYWVRRMFVVAVMGCLPLCPEFATAGVTINLGLGKSIVLSSVLQTTGKTVQIGDDVFGNFQFSYVDTDGIASDNFRASDVVLKALQDQFGYGFSLQMPLSASGDVVKDVVVEFSVKETDPGMPISDDHLQMDAETTGKGLADTSETIFTGGFGVGSIGSMDVNTSGALDSSVKFSVPECMIYVEKDILVTGNSDCRDAATICSIEQEFSQIPEPSTWMLVGLGLLGVLKCHSVRRRAR